MTVPLLTTGGAIGKLVDRCSVRSRHPRFKSSFVMNVCFHSWAYPAIVGLSLVLH